MEKSPRKKRHLGVESLEGRRLLSHLGPPPGSAGSPPAIAPPANTAGGPAVGPAPLGPAPGAPPPGPPACRPGQRPAPPPPGGGPSSGLGTRGGDASSTNGALSITPIVIPSAHGATSGSTDRAGTSGTAARRAAVPPAAGPEEMEPPDREGSTTPAVVTLTTAQEPAAGEPAAGAMVPDGRAVQGSPDALTRNPIAILTPKGLPDGRSPAGVPLGPDREGSQVAEGTDGPGRSREQADAPDPQLADLIAGFLPFDRRSLESAIDRFLSPLEDLGAAMPATPGPTGLVPAVLAAMATVLAWEAVLRLRRAEEGGIVELEGDEGLVAFPGLPGPRRSPRS
jgi:hypothetical protein